MKIGPVWVKPPSQAIVKYERCWVQNVRWIKGEAITEVMTDEAVGGMSPESCIQNKKVRDTVPNENFLWVDTNFVLNHGLYST